MIHCVKRNNCRVQPHYTVQLKYIWEALRLLDIYHAQDKVPDRLGEQFLAILLKYWITLGVLWFHLSSGTTCFSNIFLH